MSNNTINLHGTVVPFKIRHSTRAKHLSITVYPGAQVVVTKPRYVPELTIPAFLNKNAHWILDSVEKLAREKPKIILRGGEKTFQNKKSEYLRHLRALVEDKNTFYQFEYNSISVRNKKTSWGSCTKQKNLSFCFKVCLLPEVLQEYIVVHELCHLKEFNHSKNFWHLVSQGLPNYKSLRKQLRGYALS